MIIKEFHEPILQARVLFIANCSVEEVNKVLRKRKQVQFDSSVTMDGGTFHWIVDDKKGAYTEFAIWLEKKTDISSIAHEALHLTCRIFEARHIPFDNKHDEFIAYYLEYWINEMIEAYVGKKK